MAYFPMFIEIKDRQCLIVGGGTVALRKVKVLSDFGAKIKVVAPEIIDEIKSYERVEISERNVKEEDIIGNVLVVAATDDKEINHQIGQKCMELHVPVNAVDQIEDCSFIFPAYVREQDLVAAFSSSGKSPIMTQYLKLQMKELMTEKLGELTEVLGTMRDIVKEKVPTEKMRKEVYKEILAIGLLQEELPTEAQLEEVIERINNNM